MPPYYILNHLSIFIIFMKDNTISTTEYEIDNVAYVVESSISDNAKLKPCDIVKRLLLADLQYLIKKAA